MEEAGWILGLIYRLLCTPESVFMFVGSVSSQFVLFFPPIFTVCGGEQQEDSVLQQ